jgi:hypothetical protein
MAIAGTNLPCPKRVPGFWTDRHGGRGAGCWRRCRTALYTGIHVAAVVVADVQHVVVALEHSGQAAEADVGGAAVATLGHDADVTHLALLSFHLDRRGDAGGDCSGIAEQRVDPGDLPRGLGVGCREDLQATGGIGRDQAATRGLHRRVDGETSAKCFATALAGAVSGVE